jgi:uncharacterized cupin superfamily protein
MQPDFLAGKVSHDALADAPLRPGTVLAGAPRARSVALGASPDGLLSYGLWDCTSGAFRWHFRSDEIVHILEGEVTVRVDPDGAPRVLGVGDVAYFPRGMVTIWTIDRYVKKLAVYRSEPGLGQRARAVVRDGVAQLRARLGR